MNLAGNDTLMRECLALLDSNDIPLNEAAHGIIEFFFGSDHHVALRDIEDHLRGRGGAVDLDEATRTMRLLVDYGFASERRFPDGRVRYEHLHIGEHHDHFYCLRCGAIIEFASPPIEQMQEEVARSHGFHAFSHRLLIRGLCDSCFKVAAPKGMTLAAVQSGGKFRVIRVERGGHGFGFGHGARKRLADMGVSAGVQGEVLSNHGIGMMVVQIGGARLALGHGQTRKVVVELLN
jgi:Fur family transcriptional regulator, ferric uptake regulator